MSPFGLWKTENNIWIPKKIDLNKFKILITTLCGSSGHQGKDIAENTVRLELPRRQLREDMEDVMQTTGCA